MERRARGDGEAGRDCPREPAAEDIRKMRNHPPVRREGGRTRAVLQGTRERGKGGEKIEDQRTNISRTLGPVSSGDAILYQDAPIPPYPY